MNNINKTKIAIGTTLIAGFTTGCANTGDKPFSQKDLASGYMNEADTAKAEHGMGKAKDGACGEGKCGGKIAAPAAEEESKMTEGKCGEGKCGGSK